MTTVDLKTRVNAAIAELNRLCNGEPFKMSIPVQNTDSDQIIGAALLNIGELLAENEADKSMIAALISRCDEYERIAQMNADIADHHKADADRLRAIEGAARVLVVEVQTSINDTGDGIMRGALWDAHEKAENALAAFDAAKGE
jgi:hypothetical protein